ncbi:proteasome regulatory particle base subunit [Lobosporangium transversale]|uniref:26S proteasome regulatory subunit RPN2 n=1 Tax=Lobosporangium transversale TaxID=64571 RepID=A0A1Y2GJA6_9FUNG|nr:armadillo-type protein [Lobosporangium transversale]KAF9914367.1 proteasome regulatory particle base subunit [Lobosporangium transversale]ORZ12529.1 armadillo-type protein [Lobosporangium transversale]|eukprot:XP_021880148.1 armadillo-type protein [Lobosporangium transversale]
MVGLTSAAGVIALLDEQDDDLKVYALQKLNGLVDQFWAEISDSVSKIEIMYEDTEFKDRQLAALVASKVYYHLGEFDDSLNFALGAGNLFDLFLKSEYVDTIVSKCIDKYIALRTQEQQEQSAEPLDPRLKDVVEKMFDRCYQDGEYKQAVGIALESHRLDVVEYSIKAGGPSNILPYVYELAMTVVLDQTYRNTLLQLLVDQFRKLEEPDYVSINQCLVHLGDHQASAELLQSLVNTDVQTDLLMAYQLAFDLENNATQKYLKKVATALPSDPNEKYERIKSILSGKETIRLQLEFLCRNNHTDMLILKNSKTVLDARLSIYHSAVTFANAFMNAGTTSDDFLRQNLEWLSRATNWSKFSATAALGVIHKGHLAQGMTMLAPYLPQDGVTASPYSEGGSLFALGLIHANHGDEVLDYLRGVLKNTQIEVLQHGACLGLGTAGMATDNNDIYEELRSVLFSDSAIGGEAAGLAMGMVMLGTASEKALDEMLQYAHETQHEKIIRGLAVGISLVMYGKEDAADVLIEKLAADKDPILRYGGMYTIAMAYCGTGNNKAIRRLLHVAVSDVNDDVRRAAVTALGFILFRSHKQVPRIVQLLSESYNPHVRYGACLALGISCAGTGSLEAIELLEPMAKDNVDFVRQGAFIALAMILMQQNEVQNPKSAAVRTMYEEVIKKKNEDALTKFGAVLGQGIIDAGGRNVTISLQSRSGHSNMPAIVGVALFTQFWYWYPASHFLSLAFTPTAIIGVNADLNMPTIEFTSNARPSLFAYIPPTKPPTATVVEKVATAVLSTTAKAQAKAKKAKTAEPEAMEEDEKPEEKSEEAKDEEAKAAAKPKKEPQSEKLGNLARVLPAQLKYISFDKEARYVPVKKDVTGGIVVLLDNRPGEPEMLLLTRATTAGAAAPASDNKMEVEEEEAPMPEPFTYPFDRN